MDVSAITPEAVTAQMAREQAATRQRREAERARQREREAEADRRREEFAALPPRTQIAIFLRTGRWADAGATEAQEDRLL